MADLLLYVLTIPAVIVGNILLACLYLKFGPKYTEQEWADRRSPRD